MSKSKNKKNTMPPMNDRPVEKAKNFKKTFITLVNYLKKYKIRIIIVIIFAAMSAAFSIAGPKITAEILKIIIEGVTGKISGTGDVDFNKIGTILLALLSLYLTSTLFAYTQGWIMANVSMEVSYKFRKDISEKINRMPLKYFDSTNHGDILSRVANDVDTVGQSLNQSMSQIISSVTMLIGVLVMMLTISWQMSIVAFLTFPLSTILIGWIMSMSQKHFSDRQTNLGEVNAHVEEMYGGHTVVQAFNGEKQSARDFNKYNDKLYKSSWKSEFLSSLIMPIMTIVGNFGYVGICIMGGYLAINGGVGIADISAFIQYVRQFNMPITQIANISNILQQTVAAAERVFEFLDEEEETPEITKPVRVQFENDKTFLVWEGKKIKFEGVVEFKNIKFGYDSENIIINDFSAKIMPGQSVAIVGPTGAGKTTMVKLLMRFYDVLDGSISIDGLDIRYFTRNDLRSLFGIVLQDTWLYNDTIMENIRYGKLNAADSEVLAASKTARVHHFVKTLADGYKTIMNEEATNISQGQKQLMTISRAVLTDPKILILDEATSSVDTKTEIDIQRGMDTLIHGRTGFVIAHRLSTIREADLILVMKNGDIKEQGKHQELMEASGFYASLYNAQFER